MNAHSPQGLKYTRVHAHTRPHTRRKGTSPGRAHQRPDYRVPFAAWPRVSERSEGLSHTPVWRPQLPTHLVLSASFTVFPRLEFFGLAVVRDSRGGKTAK